MNGLGRKWKGYRTVKSRDIIEKLSREVQAKRKDFSFVGRNAKISYAWARAGRRWLSEGSDIVRVQRRRIVVPCGHLNGRLVGIGLLIWEGIGPLIECVSARTEYLTMGES